MIELHLLGSICCVLESLYMLKEASYPTESRACLITWEISDERI